MNRRVHIEIQRRMAKAAGQYGDYTSTHEAYGVLAEEVAELLDAIRANDAESVRDEAIDVAAVAIRLAEVVEVGAPEFNDRSGLSRG